MTEDISDKPYNPLFARLGFYCGTLAAVLYAATHYQEGMSANDVMDIFRIDFVAYSTLLGHMVSEFPNIRRFLNRKDAQIKSRLEKKLEDNQED